MIAALFLIAVTWLSSEPTQQLLASKMLEGAILDLSKVRIDPAQPNLQCGVVTVNRYSDDVKFLADTSSGYVWLSEVPLSPGFGGPIRKGASKLYVGHLPKAEAMWRICEAKGAPLPPR